MPENLDSTLFPQSYVFVRTFFLGSLSLLYSDCSANSHHSSKTSQYCRSLSSCLCLVLAALHNRCFKTASPMYPPEQNNYIINCQNVKLCNVTVLSCVSLSISLLISLSLHLCLSPSLSLCICLRVILCDVECFFCGSFVVVLWCVLFLLSLWCLFWTTC